MIFRFAAVLGLLIMPVAVAAGDAGVVQAEADHQAIYSLLHVTEQLERKDAGLMARYYRPLGNQWSSLLEGHTAYGARLTNLGIATLEHYWGDYRAAYILYSGLLADGGTTLSRRVQFNRYYAEQSWLGLALNGGQDLENPGSGRILQSDVQSLSISGRHGFSHDWSLSYEASLLRQGDYYTRNGVRFGLRRKF